MWQRSRRPSLVEAYPPVSWYDATNQPAETMPSKVNIVIVHGDWTDAQISKIQADPTYADAVLWVETDKSETPDTNSLAQVLMASGADTNDVSLAIDVSAPTKAQLADSLNMWIASQEKEK